MESGACTEDEPPKATAHAKWSLRLVYAIVFLDTAGFGIVLPMVPYFLADLGGNAKSFGYFISLFAVAQAVGGIFWGKIGDLFGRKPVLLVGMLGTAASFLTLTFSQSVEMAMFARVCSGISGGTMSAAAGYIMSVAHPAERTSCMGFMQGIKNVGFIIGPPIGGILYKSLGFRMAFFVPSAICALTFVVGALALKEASSTTPAEEPLLKDAEPDVESPETLTVSDVAPTPHQLQGCFWMSTLLICLAYMAMSLVETVIPYMLKDMLGWGPRAYTWLFLAFGLSGALTQLTVAPLISARLGELKTIVLGFALLVTAFFIAAQKGLVSSPVVLVVACLIVASGGGLLEANIVGLIANVIDDMKDKNGPQYGTYNGIKDALAMLALAVAPSLGGFVYVHYGFMVNLVGCGISAIGLVIAMGMMTTPGFARFVTSNRSEQPSPAEH